jgi:quinol monooxygenase YgiN
MKKLTVIAIALMMSALSVSAQSASSKVFLTISHEVKDYDTWKAVYDNHSAQRKEAGIVELFVKKDVNNSNSITIFSEVTNLENAKAFMSSTSLKEAMKDAGVTSVPSLAFSESALDYGTLNKSAIITTITHSVKDFSAWKEGYLSAEQVRKQNGIQDCLVLQSLSDKNLVTVIGITNSAESFNKFTSNPDLKTAMEKAGVTSKPEIKILF